VNAEDASHAPLLPLMQIPKKRKRKARKRSFVWKYFREMENEPIASLRIAG